MVLKLLCQLMFTLFLSGCSAIGYVKYEEKTEGTKTQEITQQEGDENKYIVKEYYLVPEEWWFDYPTWRWSFGFYLWEPYWWYPYYSTRCPGCYMYDPYVFKEHRKFERRNTGSGTLSEPESGSDKTFNDSSRESSEKSRGHRRFER